jgi:hypothetical protein
VLSVPRATLKAESTVVRFAEPKEANDVPSLENSMATAELPLKVRPPKRSAQVLPVRAAPLRSASNTTLTADGAIIASDSVETCPSDARTLNASKSTRDGASRFESSEPPTAALGRNSSLPLPAATGVEPKLPSTYIVPKAADSKPAPKLGSRSE